MSKAVWMLSALILEGVKGVQPAPCFLDLIPLRSGGGRNGLHMEAEVLPVRAPHCL